MEELYMLLYGVLPMIIVGACVIVVIVVIGQIIKARISSVSKHTYVKLLTELREENTKILTELTSMKENLGSINKMMKEIE